MLFKKIRPEEGCKTPWMWKRCLPRLTQFIMKLSLTSVNSRPLVCCAWDEWMTQLWNKKHQQLYPHTHAGEPFNLFCLNAVSWAHLYVKRMHMNFGLILNKNIVECLCLHQMLWKKILYLTKRKWLLTRWDTLIISTMLSLLGEKNVIFKRLSSSFKSKHRVNSVNVAPTNASQKRTESSELI